MSIRASAGTLVACLLAACGEGATPLPSVGPIQVGWKATLSLTDLDGVSIWCVQAAMSFGDAQFAPP